MVRADGMCKPRAPTFFTLLTISHRISVPYSFLLLQQLLLSRIMLTFILKTSENLQLGMS